MKTLVCVVVSAFLVCAVTAFLVAQVPTPLQLHFMNVGQGDGAVLISPGGEVVLFDDGVRNFCDLPLSYLQQLGITKIDYHVASHYHDDHIGCAEEVLTAFPLSKDAIDHGGDYDSKTFDRYKMKVEGKRKTASTGMTLTLDSGASFPVTIKFAVADGNGFAVKNENDRSVVALVHFGDFDAEIGGDLSGQNTSSYFDVETPAAPSLSQVEVYKVHHHGSEFSSNDTWLAAIKPKIGIISAGVQNKHGHPTVKAMGRLHAASVKTYWTTSGSGDAQPEAGKDIVGGNIIVEVLPGSQTFTVTYSGTKIDSYTMWEAVSGTPTQPAFSWSKLSKVYHHSSCIYVKNISPQNLQQGTTPPVGKTLHEDCPK